MKSEIEWFKVGDKVPNHTDLVLACHNGFIFPAYYYADQNCFDSIVTRKY